LSFVRWLGVVPFLCILVGVVFANRVTPLILGFPFLLAWLIFCVLLTSAVMAIIYHFDPANREPDGHREIRS
jgi:Protein of unknown function (DUF3311)